MFFDKIKQKNGSSTIYELIISLTLLTFVMFFPIGVFSYMRTETNINDIINLGMQSMEKNGELTPAMLNAMNDNLKEKDLPTFNDGTIIITNMEVTSGTSTLQILTDSQATALGYTTKYSDFVTVSPDGANTYLRKYRNAYITKSDWQSGKKVWYDIKCNNNGCGHKGEIQHITNAMEYKCKYCGNISKLETCNEANVVYMTIAVPVTEKVDFLNRIMRLISFGVGDSEIFGNSNSFIENNGEYYFVKTLYGAAERYYYVGSGVQ